MEDQWVGHHWWEHGGAWGATDTLATQRRDCPGKVQTFERKKFRIECISDKKYLFPLEEFARRHDVV